MLRRVFVILVINYFKPAWFSNFSKLCGSLVNMHKSVLLIAWKCFTKVCDIFVFFTAHVALIILKLDLICRKCSKKWIFGNLWKERAFLIVELQKTFQTNIEVKPAQANGLESVNRFVNVHLHCIVSNLRLISKISALSPEKDLLFFVTVWYCAAVFDA